MKSLITLSLFILTATYMVVHGQPVTKQFTGPDKTYQDTPKVKKDSIQYVPLFEKTDTIPIIFEILVNGINRFVAGYYLEKGFKTIDGKWANTPQPLMILNADYKIFKGAVYRAFPAGFNLNPYREPKKDTTKVKSGGKP